MQRIGYALVGPVQWLFEHVDATPGEYGEKDISPYFWHNGAFPTTSEYKQLFDDGFASGRLKIGGLVGRGQIGRGFDGHDHGPGQTQTRGEMGGVLFPR